MIGVVIVDDHDLVRAGLVELVAAAEDIEVLDTAGDGEAAIEAVARVHPQVVLMDLSMPGMDGIEAIGQINREQPDLPVVALTSFAESRQVLGALDAGAVGYLLKDASPDELRDGIRAAARGESPMSPKAARALIVSREEREEAELSPREREVLELVAEGFPNKLIARRLDISEKTVKAHLTKIFQALDVTDRTQAALWAHRHGLVKT